MRRISAWFRRLGFSPDPSWRLRVTPEICDICGRNLGKHHRGMTMLCTYWPEHMSERRATA